MVRLLTKPTKSNTALASDDRTWAAALTQQWCWWQYQSQPLAAAYNWTTSDTVSMVIKVAENAAQVDTHLAYVVRVVSGDGGTIRGVIGLYHATSTEYPTSLATIATRIHSARTDGATNFSSQIGDRIIIEIGVHGVTPTLDIVRMRWGDPSATADYALTADLTTDLDPWVELSRTVVFGQIVGVGQATETDTPQIILWRPKNRSAKQTAETDSVQVMARAKYKAIGIQAENDSVFSIVPYVVKNVAVGQIGETDLSQIVGKLKQRLIGQTTETDASQVITPAKVKIVVVEQVGETELAQSLFPNKRVSVVQAVETDLSQIVGKLKSKAVAQTTEADSTQSLSILKRLPVGQVAETDLAQSVSITKKFPVGQITETDFAQDFNALKIKQIGQSQETDSAQKIVEFGALVVGQAAEADAAQTVSISKWLEIGQIVETDLAQPVSISKWIPVDQVIETDLAQVIELKPYYKSLGHNMLAGVGEGIGRGAG